MKKKLKIYKIIGVLISTAVFFVIYFYNQNINYVDKEFVDSEYFYDQNLKIYKNDKYGFEIEIPNDWSVYENLEGIVPVYNFYPTNINNEPPFNHFSNNQHFSVYPKGLPAQGVFGKFSLQKTNFDLAENSVKEIKSYLLEDDKTWSQMVIFSETPELWDDWGFIWSRYDILNFEEICFEGNLQLDDSDCDIFLGYEIKRFGNIADVSQFENDQILKSFKFIK